MSNTLFVYLCNIPAYVLGILAMIKKGRKHQWWSMIILFLIYLTTGVEAYYASKVFDADTCNSYYLICHSHMVTLIVPLVYMFHCPEGGSRILNPTSIALWLLTFFFFLPDGSWELIPSYYFVHGSPEAVAEKGLSIFYKGRFLFHMRWAAFILFTQSAVALSQMLKLYKKVTAQGAKYTWKAKAIYFWNMSCGMYLALAFLMPLDIMQTPGGRWAFYVLSSLIIGVGSLLIILGFDLNPIIERGQSELSISEFLLENGKLTTGLRKMLEYDKVYLEAGFRSDQIIHTLGTTRTYFNRLMQALYGCTYMEYVSKQRVEHAKTLLSDTDRPLDDIAFASGFSTYIAFYYIFWRETGKTPIAWRNGDTASNLNDDSFQPMAVEDD